MKQIDPHHPVYELVRSIPKGRVLTYGHIADACLLKTPRYVGYLLHHNPDQHSIPCHRVVNAQGKTAKNFAFGFADAQRALLEAEGIIFEKNRVPLNTYLWKSL